MNLRKLSILATAASLSGCATVGIPTPIPSEMTKTTSPEIGVLTTRELGEPLFLRQVSRTYPALVFAESARIKNKAGTFQPRGPLLLSFQNAKDESFCGPVSQINPSTGTVQRHFPEFCFSRSFLDTNGIPYQRESATRVDPENFRRELLYQGKVGNELRFSYREFSGDLARPAFTQELSFDLNEGNTVGARGARLEVLEASNISITYKVREPFSD